MASKKRNLNDNLTNLGNDVKQSYKIAGFFKQLQILSKKNFLLSSRNKIGTCIEFIAPLFLIALLLLLRYAVKANYNAEPNLPTNTVYVDFENNFKRTFLNYSNESIVYYYPNNSFIEKIVKRGVGIITSQFREFSPTCKLIKILNAF